MEQILQNLIIQKTGPLPAKSIQAVLELVAEGATVPFIARYRKEKTGNLDEVQIRTVIEVKETFDEIVKRKAFLIKEIGEQNNLTAEIKTRIEKSWDLGELEEIYRPFKKKKKTKATIAREAGLEPLSQWIWDLSHGVSKDTTTLEVKAKEFLRPAAGFATYDLVLKGAQDILVEKVSNDADLREAVRKDYFENGKIISKRTKDFKPNSKFEMYAEFEEPIKSLHESKASHRYLAMRRGWQDGELSVEVKGSDEELQKRYNAFSTSQPQTPAGEFCLSCARLGLTVYVMPSISNEVHRALKDKADADAIHVFAENLRKLLLASPYGAKCVLAVDPGLRTGCKVALIDKSGQFISHTVVHILGDDADEKAKKLFSEVIKQIKIEAIAVGNGTAGRQAEAFFRKLMKDLGQETPVVMVNESGASVYSASDIARQEFPDLDVTVRGAISIARRLQDPLAELVKVEPKSIGVGQYQHDVNQSALKKSLEAVVESCVNQVGVDLNTASAPLLSFIAGIGPALAGNIVEHRKSKGLFQDRSELLKVPKFSSKVYEQSAGFLRIPSGRMVLDGTGIHPERYAAVRDMAAELGVGITDIIGSGAKKLLDLRTKWAKLVGEFTFDDIITELEKPGRDPRDPFKVFKFRDDIFEVKDLEPGMICPGLVTNVTNFGAFVDIGVHQDGLVHISALSHKFIDDPRKVVNPGDQVTVKVLAVDKEKNQISLTMKLEAAPERPAPREARAPREREERPRQDRPRDDRPREKGPRQDRAPQGGGRPQQQARGGGGRGDRNDSPRGDQQRGDFSRKPAQPFNNPFAALLNVNTPKK